MTRPLRCEIRADALRQNFRAIRRVAKARKILAVVKDDAYGHGLARVARALDGLADGFALALPEDALALRKIGIAGPIVLLNGIFSPDDLDAVRAAGAWMVVHERRQLEWLSQSPPETAKTIFIKADTGMNRLGFAPDEFAAVRDAVESSGRRAVLATHFARADSPDGLRAQMESVLQIRESAGSGLETSLGNSAATLLHGVADDWARVGIALYGASPAPGWRSRDALGLRAGMVLRTRLLASRILRKGAATGYGGEFVAAADMPMGVAAGGYGDGYPRLTRDGWARIFPKGGDGEGGDADGEGGGNGGGEGVRANVIGRVSMDLLALDLRGCPGARAGDEVVLWGDSPSADEVAASGGMIAYELLSRLPARLGRAEQAGRVAAL